MSCIGAPSDMRVALFTDSFLPFICGATFAALNQVNALANSGHEVRIYCPGSKGSDAKSAELHDSITLRKVPLSLPWGGQPDLNVVFPALWPTMKDLRAFKPDVVHVHTEWGTGWAGVYAAWRPSAGPRLQRSIRSTPWQIRGMRSAFTARAPKAQTPSLPNYTIRSRFEKCRYPYHGADSLTSTSCSLRYGRP